MLRAWLRRVTYGAVLLMSLPARTARGAPLDPRFVETQVLPSGLPGTTAMAWAPDGSQRLFYTRQLGHVNILDGAALRHFVAVTPTYVTNECGVLGLAFDPAFLSNHFLYVFVTVSNTEQRIVRYVVDGNVAGDATVLVSGLPTRGANHNAGGVGFGPDGKLYWTIGDLGNGTGAGDDLSLLAAKVARVNRDGSVPEDNPFYDGEGPIDERIWARGFRNPFTFAWQPGSDALWVSSVGQSAEQIFVTPPGSHAGWSAYENNQAAPFIAPAIAYPTEGDGASLLTPSGATRAGGVASFATQTAHGLRVGERVTVAGVSDASFDGTGFVSAVPTPTSFELAQLGPDASAGGGSVVPLDLGNAVTGGTFWDSSSLPASYRGNYFFGDYVSGNIARVTFGPNQSISSVDLWASTGTKLIDLSVGPDGDLYYATFEGAIYRVRYTAEQQGIVVSSLHVRVAEGDAATFSVRLAQAPAAPMAVSLQRSSGDGDVRVEEAELSFDASNWAVPQTVHVTATADDDAADDGAEVTLSAPGLTDEIVQIRVTDDEQPAIIVSETQVTLTPGSEAELKVQLNGRPASPIALGLELPPGAPVQIEPDELAFDSTTWSTPQATVLRAPADAPIDGEPVILTLSGRSLIPADVTVRIVAREPDDANGGIGGVAGQPDATAGQPSSPGGRGLGGETDSSDAARPNQGDASGSAGEASDPSADRVAREDAGCRCDVASGGRGSATALLLAALATARWRRKRRPAPPEDILHAR
jgi:glucose/arabinose dehydrogenase